MGAAAQGCQRAFVPPFVRDYAVDRSAPPEPKKKGEHDRHDQAGGQRKIKVHAVALDVNISRQPAQGKLRNPRPGNSQQQKEQADADEPAIHVPSQLRKRAASRRGASAAAPGIRAVYFLRLQVAVDERVVQVAQVACEQAPARALKNGRAVESVRVRGDLRIHPQHGILEQHRGLQHPDARAEPAAPPAQEVVDRKANGAARCAGKKALRLGPRDGVTPSVEDKAQRLVDG